MPSDSIHADGRPITEPQSGDEPSDIRSLLESALDAQDASQTDTEQSSEGRTRGADGKFVKAEAAATAPEPSESDPPQTPVKSESEKPETEASPKTETSTEAPAAWSSADKEMFKAIPAAAQEFVLRRHKEMETDYTRKTQEVAALREFEPVRQMLAPHRDAISRGGFTVPSLIQSWMNVEGRLTSGQGLGVVKDIVNSYRIDKTALARELGLLTPGAGTTQPAPAEGQTPIQLPPHMLSYLEKLDERQRMVEQNLTARQQQEQNEERNRLSQTITAFQDAKDPSGNVLHPHFEELKTEIAMILEAGAKLGQEPTLAEAYEKAVWANTSTRQKQLEATRAAEEAQRAKAQADQAKEARAKAERARKAGSSVTGAPGSGQAAINGNKAAPLSVRDAIAAAMDQHADA